MSGDQLADIQDEFWYYWNGDSFAIDAEDVPTKTLVPCSVVEFNRPDRPLTVFCANQQRLEAVYRKLGFEVERGICAAFIVDTAIFPRASNLDWPPETLHQFLPWLQKIDNESYKSFNKMLEQLNGSRFSSAAFVVRHSKAWYGIVFSFPQLNMMQFRRGSEFRQTVHRRSKSIGVSRISPYRIDAEYLVNRNHREGARPLTNMRIAQLADQLVRNGAGSGGGELTLIDNQILSHGNIGRHYLGLLSMNLPKASSLAESIGKNIPGANIVPNIERAENLADDFFDSFDLVLDATGQEGIIRVLSQKFYAGRLPPLIMGWVVGNGIASQAYALREKGDACIQCISPSDSISPYSPLKGENELEISYGGGCEQAYIPFSSAAANIAASLMVSLALQFASETPGPPLRTVVIDHANAKQVKDRRPKKSEGCAICQT